MTEREQKIRELVERLTRPESGVSPEFSVLSVDDAHYLLSELTAARMMTVTLSAADVGEMKALLRGERALPREAAGIDFPLSESFLSKFK